MTQQPISLTLSITHLPSKPTHQAFTQADHPPNSPLDCPACSEAESFIVNSLELISILPISVQGLPGPFSLVFSTLYSP